MMLTHVMEDELDDPATLQRVRRVLNERLKVASVG